ncbi:TPA: hypothetical protein I9069_003177 [Clostridium perfringens]|nr:hypothetical protein [Clostridium perfringens]
MNVISLINIVVGGLTKKEQKELFIKLGYRNVRKLCMDLCYIVSYSRLSFDDDFRLMWIER